MSKRHIWLATPLAAALLLSGPALAHHGWNWTSGENIQLTGTIKSMRLGNPHGIVMMQVGQELWRLEVGQPWRNQRAGLKDGDLAVGVVMKVDGEPSRDPDDKRLKVERLWIGDAEYVLYRERI